MKYELIKVVDALDGLIWTASADGLVDFVNRRWIEYTGLGLEQARGPGWQAAFHPADLPLLLDDGAACRASGKAGDTEARMRRFDGEYRWFLIRALPLTDESGQVIGWCGLNIDIEDRKCALEALRERERELRDLLDRVPGFLAVADSQGRHEYANSRSLAYTHTTLEELSGLGFVRSVHPDEQESIRALWLRCVELSEAMDVVHRLRRFDGVYRWFHTRVEPFVGEDGKIVRWYGLLTDIDEQRRAEDALRQREQELSGAMQIATVAQLSASIAHEINQPLSGIITNASTCLRMLAANPPDIEGALETARRTIRDGHRAAEVIARLRALFSKEGGTSELFDLNEAAREVMALLRSQFLAADVLVQMDLCEALPLVMGDRVQIQQVIMNLVVNALEALNGVADRQRQLVLRSSAEEGGRVSISVQDTGTGLDAQGLDKLFEAFYTTKGGGMGIGLSVCRSIIDRHHGTLLAALNDGPGATFSFSIPVMADASPDAGRPGEARKSAMPNPVGAL